MATATIATNIEEVLAQLEDIISNAEKDNDRIGYFAALYHRVTLKVKEDLDAGLFENGSRLAYLDVLFANRYIFAAREWKKDPNSPLVSKSWKIAFDNLSSPSKLVLEHLLLGMNAHINFDLGIAVVEAAKNGGNMVDLRRDYNAINNILAALTYSIFNKLNLISPFLSVLGFTGTKSNSMLVQFSLGNARDGAWGFATDLNTKTGNDYLSFIAERDTTIEDLGKLLVKSKGMMKIGIFIIHLFEWKKPDRIIQVLYEHQKKYFKKEELQKNAGD